MSNTPGQLWTLCRKAVLVCLVFQASSYAPAQDESTSEVDLSTAAEASPSDSVVGEASRLLEPDAVVSGETPPVELDQAQSTTPEERSNSDSQSISSARHVGAPCRGAYATPAYGYPGSASSCQGNCCNLRCSPANCGSCINCFGYAPCTACCRNTRIYRAPLNGHIWLGMEYWAWFTKGNETPILVSASPSGTPLSVAGIIGEPTTSILFGNETIHNGLSSGGRISAGWWCDLAQTSGWEASFFGVDGDDVRFQAVSTGNEILARPFFDVDTGLQARELFAFPTTSIAGSDLTQTGLVDVDASMDLTGAEIAYRRLFACTSTSRTEYLIGYRYGRFDDRLDILEVSQQTEESPTQQIVLDYTRHDLFRAKSDFHGAELGLRRNYWHSRWGLELLGKLALGGTYSRVRVDGGTAATVTTTDLLNPNDPPVVASSTAPHGLLAQASNIGTVSRRNFGAQLELGSTVEYAFSCQCRVNFGYSLLYWSGVARVMDHVDVNLDRSQFQPLPTIQLSTSDFWAQGFRMGAVYQF